MYLEKPETKNKFQILNTEILKIISRLNEKNKDGIPIFEGMKITTQNDKEIFIDYHDKKETIRMIRITVNDGLKVAICEGDYMPFKEIKVSKCKNFENMIALIVGMNGD